MTNLNDGSRIHQIAGARRVRFGAFEVDFEQRELRHRGIRISLQRKPFQILELLLRKPGTLVTRAELAQHLWPGLHVSFAGGLNTAINTLRQALNDSPGASRYIETRSGLGYCFVAKVEAISETPHEIRESTGYELGRREPHSQEAHRDYLKGRYLQAKMTESDLGKSIAHFESAIAQDPRCALAYTGLANTYSLFALLGMLVPPEARRRIEELTMTALQIDPELAEAHASLGVIREQFDRNYTTAESEYRLALELNPKSIEGNRRYAAFLGAMGRDAEASATIRRAQELEPLSRLINVEVARNHFVAHRFEECVQQAWQTLVLEPDFFPAQHMLGLAYEQLNMFDEAITELENARAGSRDNPELLTSLGHAYAISGQSEKADGILRELSELSRQRYVSPYLRGIVYIGLAMKDRALESIEKACDERDVWLVRLRLEPRFESVRSDRRFERVLRKAGFSEGL